MPATDTYRERAATLAGGILKQHARDVDTSGRFPRESVAALGPELLGMCVPAEFGGGGQGLRPFGAVVEALAQSCSSTAMVLFSRARRCSDGTVRAILSRMRSRSSHARSINAMSLPALRPSNGGGWRPSSSTNPATFGA